ncbi:MAG: hypothetical protein HY360_03075 [Verrucomicrobia bacterium]|nr:hypothetical protein [Verrucomicrobiota bacterium]
MGIIVLLAGIVVGVSSYANRVALESRMKAEIRAMETALEAYKRDNGAYPPLDTDMFNGTVSPATNSIAPAPGDTITAAFPASPVTTNMVTDINASTSGWLNIHFVYRALNPGGGAKNYMTFTAKQLKTLTNTQNSVQVPYKVILDPMGKPYGYAPRDPQVNYATFDLWSAGLDSKSGYPTVATTNDDIGNWQR